MRAISYMFAAAFCLALSGCDSGEDAQSTGIGWINFLLDINEVSEAPIEQPFSLYLTTDIGPSYSHTWSDISFFPSYEGYLAGPYHAMAVSGEPGAEGYGCPCYIGEIDFLLSEGGLQDEKIICELQQSMHHIAIGDGLGAAYPGAAVGMHAAGYSYVQADPDEQRPMLVMPGKTSAYVTLADAQGRQITVCPPIEVLTEQADAYEWTFDFKDGELVAACGGQEGRMKVAPELFSTSGPQIADIGFESGSPIRLTEGYPAQNAVKMRVTAPAGLSRVVMTSLREHPSISEAGKECNLLYPPQALIEMGLKAYRTSEENLEVDFTDMLANLSVADNSSVEFYVKAYDKLGRVSATSALRVDISSVELKLVDKAPAVIGVDTASVSIGINTRDVEIEDFKGYILDDFGQVKKEVKILHYELDQVGRVIKVSFPVDPGTRPVPMLIDYMGNPKLRFDIDRQVPEYKIWVDPFATTALLLIEGETPEATRALTEYAKVTANGVETGIVSRMPDAGAILLAGLRPGTRYAVQPVIIAGGYAPTADIVTEEALEIPDGDFEDNYDSSISYKGMPMGGTYSTSQFPLYNMQNYKDVKVSWMQRNWASVNAKTFCQGAKRHNTWYMQPSSAIDFEAHASGTKSMRLQSVGWSLDGEEIAPYAQNEGEYLPYNNHVPYVSHRSAGKLFLGSYSFDPATGAEAYNEGMPFASRPSSLNGFYKYQPDRHAPSDAGLVEVELVNDEGEYPVVIASARMELTSAPDFIAFNLPLDYAVIGMKPTKVKVMFASSKHAGTIEEEDIAVPASADVIEAACLGSVLWIDNLSFSY